MAITVSYSVTPWRITVPKADLTLESGTKFTLDVDAWWSLLRDYADSAESMPNPIIYSRIPATASTPSITEINLNFYRVQFEDGLYSVNIINGNTNIREGEVKNQVSVNTNNTTGFIAATFLEHGTFGGAIHINQTTGIAETVYPAGTPSAPVNNISDAKIIAAQQGLEALKINGLFTFAPTDVIDSFVIEGVSSSKTTLVLTTAANITNCIFRRATLTEQFDGGNDASFCVINSINFFDGSFLDCLLVGTVTLGGAQANFLRCASAVAGGGASQTPTIDFNNSATNLLIRDYQGGIKLINCTAGSSDVSIDMSSGQVIFDSTIASGSYTVRGIAKVVDNSTGTASIIDETISKTVEEIRGQIPRSVFINTELIPTGNGYQQSPFNNWTSAVDYAEANGLLHMELLADATVDRLLKNFIILGVGLPSLDLNGQIMDNTLIDKCSLTGSYTGKLEAKLCALVNLSGMDGIFFEVSAAGTLTVAANGSVLISRVAPAVPNVPWTLDMNTGSPSSASVHNSTGDVTITNMDNAGDVLSFHGIDGQLTISASCVAGTIQVAGNVKVINNSTGTTVDLTRVVEQIIFKGVLGAVP